MRQFRKGLAFSIHAPDADRQYRLDASLSSLAHEGVFANGARQAALVYPIPERSAV
jgi:hypothetical protein